MTHLKRANFKTLAVASAAGLASIPTSPVYADDSLTVGGGAGVAPRFIGSDEVTPIPFPFLEYTRNGRTLRTNQFGFEADLTNSGNWDFGPIVRIDQGRNDFQSASNAVIETLDDVSAAVEIGGFIETARPILAPDDGAPLLFTARASLVDAIGGHNGFLVEPSVGLLRPGQKWTYAASLTTTYASGLFQDAFFSVDAANAAASGLDVFDAGAGFRDVGVSSLLSYKLSKRRWLNS
ncbi:MAG: MipA/OmpV family protein, partial [Maricaulaceae bacterium]